MKHMLGYNFQKAPQRYAVPARELYPLLPRVLIQVNPFMPMLKALHLPSGPGP